MISSSTEAVTWPAIDPQDIDIAEFDYSLFIGSAALASASAQIVVERGTDADAASMLLGAPTVIGAKVYQRIAGRVAGVHYKLRMRAVLSDGREKVLSGAFRCEMK